MQHHRPARDVLRSLHEPCRLLLHDRAAFDDHYLAVLDGVLPADHRLRAVPGLALELLDVVLAAVLSGQTPEGTEAECRECGARCAEAGLADDSFTAVGRALAWAARESAGEAWTAAMSSGWVAVQFWVVPQLALGAAQARARDEGWSPFPELVPPPGVPADGETSATVGAAGAGSAGSPGSAGSEWDLLERAAGFRRVDLGGGQRSRRDVILRPGGPAPPGAAR